MEFYYLLNVIILARLFFFFRDNPVSAAKVIILTIIEIIFLAAFKINFALAAFILILIILNVLFYFLENKSKRINFIRCLSLILNIILISMVTSEYFSVQFNFDVLNGLKNISKYFSILNFINNLEWLKFNIILTGFLLLLNEVNFIIRYFFEAFSLVPQIEEFNKTKKIDEKEYKAGRVIGMLERVLILFFVLINQYSAIGFIIAAKGFTRFKDLDKREFAEYVLIGTLLSSFIAIVISILVKTLIK